MPTDFIESTFSPIPAFGFVATPQFRTVIAALDNGGEQRNGEWISVKHAYTAPFLNIGSDEYLILKDLFMVANGSKRGFRFKDWLDFEAIDEVFGAGDGSTAVFQLVKTSTFGSQTYTRTIKKPNSAGFSVKVDGVLTAATVDTTTGRVTFTGGAPAPNAVLTWSGTFDVPVRFASDQLPFSLDNKNAVNSTGVTLIEDPNA